MKRLMPFWCAILFFVVCFSACPGVKLPQEKGIGETVKEAVATADQEPSVETQADAHEKGVDTADAPPSDASEAATEVGKEPVGPDTTNNEAGPEQTTPDKVNTRFTIPATGGKVCYKHICVDVPGSATPEKAVQLVIKEAPNPLRGSLLPPMDVGPDNWKPVDKVLIEFDYSSITLPAGVAVSQLRVAFVQGGKWVYVPTQVDIPNKKISGQSSHFSVWGVVVSGQSCGRTGDCHDAQICNGTRCEDKNCASTADCAAGQVCTANICVSCVPVAEICDGVDNNCDGQIDENVTRACYSGPSGTQGNGVCAPGLETCTAGQWGICVGEIKPTTEVCDGKDNDCNGQLDESCTTCRSVSDCQAGEACTNGRCTQPCAAGQTLCAGGCSDLKVDDNNCGVCDNKCSSGKSCQSASCQ